ncbi:MAG: hypothetical protein AB7D38_00495 [Sulfurimonas sp.]|uniref:hypothetical protein n=1 Tax=Sulfurimonas sp. TaxID=2022749 RepID=UPI000CCE31E8|nr:MAG: hypothetical protein C0627_11660 [Sulfurimonas sp.]
MKIQTQYNYEKTWRTTNEDDLLKIIEEEVGDADPKGTLSYIKEAIKTGKVILVGDCRFRKMSEEKNDK